jgi:hypothetical protein
MLHGMDDKFDEIFLGYPLRQVSVLMQLTAWEDFIEFSRRKSSRTYDKFVQNFGRTTWKKETTQTTYV